MSNMFKLVELMSPYVLGVQVSRASFHCWGRRGHQCFSTVSLFNYHVS